MRQHRVIEREPLEDALRNHRVVVAASHHKEPSRLSDCDCCSPSSACTGSGLRYRSALRSHWRLANLREGTRWGGLSRFHDSAGPLPGKRSVTSRRRSDVAGSYERPIRATYFFFRTRS